MASTYLNRTFSTPTNNKKWTYSLWVKRASPSTDNGLLSCGANGNNRGLIYISSGNTLGYFDTDSGTDTTTIVTNRLFRDVSAWYHIVIAVDTTQATSSDRVKIYVNGTQETSLSSSTYPLQNYDGYINSGIRHDISGRNHQGTSDLYFDGEMAHVNFIDGTAYDASAFGETDATTGIWKPKTAPSVTYGTNGFFLKFENSGAFGTDSSGNANNFTVNGTMTQTIDTPSNVFATINPLFNPDPSNPLGSISNGNLSFTTNSTSQSSMGVTTFGGSSGKYYAEIKLTGESGSGEAFAGIGYDIYENATSSFNADSSFMWNVCSNGDAKFGGSGQGVGNWSNTYTTNDIISIALDLDNNRVYFAKNGQYADGSGNWNQAFTGSPAYATITADKTYFFCAGDKSTSQTASWSCNFGNGYFGTTAVSSAENPDDGIGIFEYAVPSGYKALCSKSINAQEYD